MWFTRAVQTTQDPSFLSSHRHQKYSQVYLSPQQREKQFQGAYMEMTTTQTFQIPSEQSQKRQLHGRIVAQVIPPCQVQNTEFFCNLETSSQIQHTSQGAAFSGQLL